jgi:hypothetical protein
MRAPFQVNAKIIICAAALLAAAVFSPRTADALVCSVLDEQPCLYQPFQQFCDVFDDRPCAPEFEYPFSQQLQLTIESRDHPPDAARDRPEREAPEKLGTIRAVFAALRGCWVPPARQDSRPGTQLSVRLSFKRSGEIFGKPRVTYVTPGIPTRVRQAYWDAVEAALERCTPLAFTDGLGGALAGRPFAIRFVDRRPAS